MKSVNEFHAECLAGFVEVAQRFGCAAQGVRGNDVLARRAEQSVRELLKFRPLIKLFGEDPTMYYYYINGLSFAMGVVLAMLQANAPQKFQERDLIPMIVNDPETSAHDLAFHTLQQFGMAPEIYNQFVQELYKKFQELHEPYWKAKEPRDYTLAAFYASFMTGCSVAIGKFEERVAQRESKTFTSAAKAEYGKPVKVVGKPAARKPAAKKVPAKKPAAKRTSAAKESATRKTKKSEG